MRKVCIIEATSEAVPIIENHLPPGVAITGRRETFDRNVWELRLEGDGLPPWCVAPSHGMPFIRATGSVGEDRQLHLTPGVGLPVQQVPTNERIVEG